MQSVGSSRDGNFEIYVMNIDGTGVARLTTHPGLDTRPAWSPDGGQIAYTSVRNGNYETYLMNADGTDPRNITNHDERDDYAAWHPNGQHLVHIAERNGRFDLYQTNVSESARPPRR